jgi:hypothetical protein
VGRGGRSIAHRGLGLLGRWCLGPGFARGVAEARAPQQPGPQPPVASSGKASPLSRLLHGGVRRTPPTLPHAPGAVSLAPPGRPPGTNAGKSRGYAFIEYEHKTEMKEAYKAADGKKIEGRRVLVDVERGRTVDGW